MGATTAQVIAIIGGAIVIAASIWRFAVAILRVVRRFDQLMTEHEQLLRSTAANTDAIIIINKRLDRQGGRRG